MNLKQEFYKPTADDLALARETFEKKEPRDLFYRAATELMDLAIKGETKLSIAEALAVLLQTWNMVFYRYKKFDSDHFSQIENIVSKHQQTLMNFRERAIKDYCDQDKGQIKLIFMDFSEVLGPVGTAKCLHLFAPRFFPLWDRKIAQAGYGFTLQSHKSANEYCQFIEIAKDQCGALDDDSLSPLKSIDEYNYCLYTKDWIKKPPLKP